MIDGYSLYDQVANGDPSIVAINGATYRFQLKGTRHGSNNWLEVTADNGETERWGWGWNSEVCWHCLSDLERGWDSPRKHPYRPYGEYSHDDE
jgi:hypothetical protein